jgi:hypothetical protein
LIYSTVESKQDYSAEVQVAVSQLHNRGATRGKSVPVHNTFRGKTAWWGDAEVFDLHGHAKAKRCFAWRLLDSDNDVPARFVAVREIPPVKSAKPAVRLQAAKYTKQWEKCR